MESLRLNQPSASDQVALGKPKKSYRFSASRWLLSTALLALGALAVTQVQLAQELVQTLLAEIELLQGLLEDPGRWLN